MAKKKVKKKVKKVEKVETEDGVLADNKDDKYVVITESQAEELVETAEGLAEKQVESVKGKLYNPIGNAELYERIIALEQRLGRIVTAISKAKSVKGL